MLAIVKGMTMDEPKKPSRVPDLLRFEERYATSSTRQQRTKKKITTNEIRPNVQIRVDVGAEIRCLKLAVTQVTRQEWQCYVALKEGVLFEGDGADRWWHVVPLPQRTATPEQAARHYHLRVETVERYERKVREVLDTIRAAAGLIGKETHVPIWPSIQSDEALLRFLFPTSRRR